MTFRITYNSEWYAIDALYPSEGWDDDHFQSWDEDFKKKSKVIEKLIRTRKQDRKAFDQLCRTIIDSEDIDRYLEQAGGYLGCSGELEVETGSGDIIFSSAFFEFQEANPAIKEVIPQHVYKEFCLVKVWEDRGCGVEY